MDILQAVGCTKGDYFPFTIGIDPYEDGTYPDLTGATALWTLYEGMFEGAQALLQKSSADGGVTINRDDATHWQLIVNLDPADTASIPAGLYYHDAKVLIGGGTQPSHIEGGPFELRWSGNP